MCVPRPRRDEPTPKLIQNSLAIATAALRKRALQSDLLKRRRKRIIPASFTATIRLHSISGRVLIEGAGEFETVADASSIDDLQRAILELRGEIRREGGDHGNFLRRSAQWLKAQKVDQLSFGRIMIAIEDVWELGRFPEGPGPDAPSYSRVTATSVRTRCRILAADPPVPWVDEVLDHWPGVIAHEYYRLKELLEQGELFGAVWQIKDLAEVLLKVPAIVMARDVLAHGSDDEMAAKIRAALLGRELSFGTWAQITRDVIVPAALKTPNILFPELAPLFMERRGSNLDGRLRQTGWFQTIDRLVNWRNEQFAHGAMRLDPDDFLDGDEALSALVRRINDALRQQADAGVFQDTQIHLDGELDLDGKHHSFNGWQPLRHRHNNLQRILDGPNAPYAIPVLLTRGDRTLSLSPYIAARRCQICHRADVFIYDGRKAKDRAPFIKLDYLSGHRNQIPFGLAPDLAAEGIDNVRYGGHAPSDGDDSAAPDDPYVSRQLEELLQDRLLAAKFIAPTYLYDALHQFLNSRDRGIWHLMAPGHIGKTLFVNGLMRDSGSIAYPLGRTDLIDGLFVKREINYRATDLRDLFRRILEQRFGMKGGALPLQELDLEATDPPASFIAMAQVVRDQARKRGHERIILFLDGLDELPRAAENTVSLERFIPKAEQLPQDVYLILTSRPPADCPAHIRDAIAGLDTANVTQLLFDVDGKGNIDYKCELAKAYKALLRGYFDRELKSRRKRELAASPDEAGRAAVAQRYDRAFKNALEKAEGRFLYLAHITELLGSQRVAQDDIAALPAGAHLYGHFLDQLKAALGGNGKPWDMARRIILLLAASEAAWRQVERWQLSDLDRQHDFPGLPLSVIGDLLGGEPRSYRLISTLYSLREVLGTHKGEMSADTNYRLGLKGMAASIASTWADDIQTEHARLVAQTRERLEPDAKPDLNEPTTRLLVEHVIAHAALHDSGEELDDAHGSLHRAMAQWKARDGPEDIAALTLLHRVLYEAPSNATLNFLDEAWRTTQQLHMEGFIRTSASLAAGEAALALAGPPNSRSQNIWASTGFLSNRIKAIVHNGRFCEAIFDCGAVIGLRKAMSEAMSEAFPARGWHSLATAYMDRGAACDNTGAHAAAIRDYGTAIAQIEALRSDLGEVFPEPWLNDLAGAYMNRGNAQRNTGAIEAAIADYDTAIGLRESLPVKVSVGASFPAPWRNDLAAAYMNRGNALGNTGAHDAAIADYGTAIEFMEGLRAEMGDAFPAPWRNDLAVAYFNRGVVLKSEENTDAALNDATAALALHMMNAEALGMDNIPNPWRHEMAKAAALYKDVGGELPDDGEADDNAASPLSATLQQVRDAIIAALPKLPVAGGLLRVITDAREFAALSRAAGLPWQTLPPLHITRHGNGWSAQLPALQGGKLVRVDLRLAADGTLDIIDIKPLA